jgi:2-alkenal reductase
VITAVNGEPVHSISDLATILEQVGIGKSVSLKVVRNGQSRAVDVTVVDVSELGQG